MSFVDDDCIGSGQQVTEPFLFEHQVSKEQMMIDDHNIRALSFTPRICQVATVELRTLRTQAVFACRCDPWPHWIDITQSSHLGDVAPSCDLRPFSDLV